MVASSGTDSHAGDAASVPPAGEQKKLDAGALFVLESKGSWLHCAYHLTTSIVSPALLSLPLAFASLGWASGVACLVMGAAITFYSYNLLSLVLEHHDQLGRRQLRFRDMAHDILVFGAALLGGQSLKSIYLITRPEGTMKFYEFVAIFGVFMMVLAQIPSFHSLRHVNLISLILCLAYSACATAGSIHAGHSVGAPRRDYSLSSDSQDRSFGIFSGIAIITTTYGNGIIPEIQATAAPPVTGKMFKGLCFSYVIVIMTFFSVAISGYWAFGNQAEGSILTNFILKNNSTLVPKWFLMMTNLFVLLQLAAVGVIYLQPTNEILERLFADPTKHQYSARNIVPRLIFRSLSIAIATLIAAMLPFFGAFNAAIGAFGFLPLDFAVPSVMYNITFKPSKRGLLFWLNTTIAIVFSILAVLGSISAVRQIVLDAKTYKLFTNIQQD
ncbi:Transmembrane amino acid transporter protein [Musa troglodytarum]|uniref:Transmembrane amino acid transporter protein n=1 Tax=Musa troglodytarum TaxID=320322 RepID=A0A9E7EA04_9LILI|nr:Transmembrane amino acid transporter protein [Musa troglodytarum]